MKLSHNNKVTKEALQKKPLAFSSSPNLTPATARLILQPSNDESTFLNIEVFDPSPISNNQNNSFSTVSSLPILLFIPGICESAETISVQNVFNSASKHNVRVAVLEMEGHGLSTGQLSHCRDFSRLLRHALEFVSFTLHELGGVDKKEIGGGDYEVPYAICGTSLGGALALYAADIISKKLHNDPSIKDQKSLPPSLTFPSNFWGAIPISPAVGVQKEAIPSTGTVLALSMAAMLVPSANLSLTPLEEPEHYNCPPETTRNYSGHWPLGTSKMLLDLTTRLAPQSIASGELNLKLVENVLIITGAKDQVVPLECSRHLHDCICCKKKELKVMERVGHDVLINPKSFEIALEYLFSSFVGK